ncbi:hypothetical protein EVAR_94442_1 [Eumeta japonica]|uniref:Uncharacterized protein n=1 Tax=Eumeta variegata TaxID=151549 RepID=A0A4C1TQ52_EUMVA|nr:hypothetical protein EVAR_94442_1 [Eumeta japonica]
MRESLFDQRRKEEEQNEESVEKTYLPSLIYLKTLSRGFEASSGSTSILAKTGLGLAEYTLSFQVSGKLQINDLLNNIDKQGKILICRRSL